MITKKQKELIENFEKRREEAEIKVLSNLSLERPLTNEEYKRMLALAKKLNIKRGE